MAQCHWAVQSGQVIAATAFLHASMTDALVPHERSDLSARIVGWYDLRHIFPRQGVGAPSRGSRKEVMPDTHAASGLGDA